MFKMIHVVAVISDGRTTSVVFLSIKVLVMYFT